MTTDPKPLTMTPSYRAMVRGTRELHQLIAEGKDDSPEADAIRDATDGPWQALSEVERTRVQSLSEDLYSLAESPTAQSMNPQAQARLVEAFEAKNRGEWDRALDLLRRWRAHIDPSLVNYLRGSIWFEAGDPETAAIFLKLVDPSAALKAATEILQRHKEFSPDAIALAAKIAFQSARLKSETEANLVFEQLEPILKHTITRMEKDDPTAINGSTHVMLLSLLGFVYDFLGKTQAALECYSAALLIDSSNDALYVARGMLLYGSSARSITDFETAIQFGTPLVWPYVMLAHHHLLSGRFEECRRFCEQAIRTGASASVMSEVCEWMAIAQTHLIFPPDFIRASFDRAIQFDPSNLRAKRNLAAFEAANRPVAWETRTASAIRNSGLAEMRYAIAA